MLRNRIDPSSHEATRRQAQTKIHSLTQQVLVSQWEADLGFKDRTSSTRQSQVGGLARLHTGGRNEMSALNPDDLNIWVKHVLEKETSAVSKKGKVEYVQRIFGQSSMEMPTTAPNFIFPAGILACLVW
jgi:hypothetical protein